MGKSSTMSFVKGVGVGMAAGATAVTVCRAVMKKGHSISKGSSKVVHAVGEFVDGITTMIK